MNSIFDTNEQNKSIDARIVAALERISEAFRTLLWDEGKKSSLSPIQIQILIFLLYHPAELRRVSRLADEFNLTKATVSDSVKTLEQKGLVRKKNLKKDSRGFIIELTDKGAGAAKKASTFANLIKAPVSELDKLQKTQMLAGLLHIINDMQQNGVITVQRMCLTCRFFEKRAKANYCNLLQSELKDQELRLDCPEHELLA